MPRSKSEVRWRNTGTGGAQLLRCPDCGKERWLKLGRRWAGRRCRPCAARAMRRVGSANPKWKGGRRLAQGYWRVSADDGKAGSYQRGKFEHVLIAEATLKRPLKVTECVHHVNGVKTDNRRKNLVICTRAYHGYLHMLMAARYMAEHFGGADNS